MRWGLVALVIAAGCGRIGFGAIDPANGDAGADADVDAASAFAIPVQIQHTSNDSVASVNTLSVSFVTPIAAGDLVLVGIGGYYAATQITDDSPGGSNRYASAGVTESDQNSNVSQIWYANNTRPGATTVTVVLAGSDNVVLWILEYSGIDPVQPLAGGAVAESDSAESIAYGGATPVTRPNSIMFAVASGAGLALASGTGFFDLSGANGGDAAVASFDRGVYFATWNSSPPGEWASSTAAFSPAPL